MHFVKNISPHIARNLFSILLVYFAYKKFSSPGLYQNINELISFVLNDPVFESTDKYEQVSNILLALQVLAACSVYSIKLFDFSVFAAFTVISINLVSALISLFYGTMSTCSISIFNGNPYFIIGLEGFLALLILMVYLNKAVYFPAK